MTVGWLIFIGIAAVFAQSAVFFRLSYKKLDYRRFWSEEQVNEGDSLEMIELLENRKILPLPFLKAESRISPGVEFFGTETNEALPGETFHKSVFFVGGMSRIKRRHRVHCVLRGVYVLDNAYLTSGDLFGTSPALREITGRSTLYVCPKPLAFDEIPSAALEWQGEIITKRWINPDPALVMGVRPLEPGDPFRLIHHGASARLGQLQAKLLDAGITPRILVVFNTRCSLDLWNTMSPEQKLGQEYGLRLASAIFGWAYDQGFEAGFATNGTLFGEDGLGCCLPPECSEAHLRRLERALARTQLVVGEHFHLFLSQLELTEPTDLCILSAYTDPHMEREAALLRERGHTVTFLRFGEEAVYES